MNTLGFDFLKADVENEVCIGDFVACRYLVLTNGEKMPVPVMSLLAGRFLPIPWSRQTN